MTVNTFWAFRSGNFSDPTIYFANNGDGPQNVLVPGASDVVSVNGLSSAGVFYPATVNMDGAVVGTLLATAGNTLTGSFTALQSMDLNGVTVSGGSITSDGGLGLEDVTLGGGTEKANSLAATNLNGAMATITTSVLLAGATTNSNISAGSVSFSGTMSASTITYDGDTSNGSGSAILFGQVSSSTISGFDAITIGGAFDSTTLSSTFGIAVTAALTGSGITFEALSVTLAYDGTLDGVAFMGVKEVSNSGSLTIESDQSIQTADFTSSNYLMLSSGAEIDSSGNVELTGSNDILGTVRGTGVALTGGGAMLGSIFTHGPGTEQGGAGVLLGGGSYDIAGNIFSGASNVVITELGGVAALVTGACNILADNVSVSGAALNLTVSTITANGLDIENGFGEAAFSAVTSVINIARNATIDAALFGLSGGGVTTVGGNLAFGDPGANAITANMDNSNVNVGGNFSLSSGARLSLTSGTSLTVTGSTTISNGSLTISGGSVLQQNGSIIAVGISTGNIATLNITDAGSRLTGKTALLFVGYGGFGYAEAKSGAIINVATIDLGGLSASSGTLLIDGAATTASLGLTIIGDAGSGQLDLANGASITVGDLILGNQTGSSGSIDVKGNSFLTVTGSADLGAAAGSTSQITVSDNTGGTDFQKDLIIGDAGQTTLPLAQMTTNTAESTVEIGKQAGSNGTLAIATGATFTVNGTLDAGVAQGATGQITVDGQGSGFTANVAATIGDGGIGGITVTNAASVDIIGTLTEGATATSTGTDTISNKNTSFHAHSDWLLALAGTHSTTISDQAKAQVDGAFTIAQMQGATGTLTLTGQDSTLTSGASQVPGGGDDVTIGGAGNAIVNINPGATFDASLTAVTIAEGATSSSAVTVIGDNSVGNATSGQSGEFDANTLIVGGAGDGTLDAESSGTVNVNLDMTIAESGGSFGEVIVDGSGTGLSVGGDLRVGGAGTGTLSVGGANSSVSVLGATKIAESGAGTLAIEGGEFDATGKLSIGDDGNGAAFVQLGGSLQAAAGLTIGESANATGALTVSASNATISGGDLVVGSFGHGQLIVNQSGFLDVLGNVTLADQQATTLQSLTVDTGGTLLTAGDFTLGGNGHAQGQVLGGGQLIVAGLATIGDQPMSQGSLSVSGTLALSATPSVFTFGTLAVGNAGTGALTLSGGALAGGPVGGSSAIVVQIGVDAKSAGSVTVTDRGTTLTASTLDIGSAAGGSGTLDILAGALVKAADVTVSATGTLELNGGTLTTDPLTLDAGAMITASGEIDGDISGQGSITISPGGALSLTGGVAAGISIDFAAGASEMLNLAQPGNFVGSVSDFAIGDSIGLGQYASVTSNFINNELIVTSAGQQIAALQFVGNDPSAPIFASVIGGEVVIACYAEGTHIATPSGELAVEALRAGDTVLTASGAARPVTWVGHRHLDCSRHRKPETVWPVRVHADAFGPGLPGRDLLLSPEHAVAQGGVLIPIHCLINGTNITQERRARITYWHVELAEHDLLLAENLPAESYLGDHDHAEFDGGAVRALHPGFARRASAEPCAPIRTQGPVVEATRARLRHSTRRVA